ncbi:hypothetical protein C5E02_09800 [Rathayibacter rathayi]|uniref:DUF222 domain-containing protein n=1 Tax=Rathayibacter rathayi TaxID=33887 RepID=A0ABD6W6A6_RATRA|nr:hypothetical protein [Rathayibacter rathayi]AZZ49503.1 hypothetical protein C1O28_10095 [Rathayibacter rathayi]MWV73614.1 hypothetical protein [Rathayibacter rathayi NCPPB 2980 = VKM Ac-1601]PPF11747.1 hypothetical protein C5C04_11715 [Rathayibacter rathayi]PPF47832.1 hypothetical protein C5C08_10630 [Rathayibacter rathayi]PPF78865.1 hypothetical protein C5C14_10270 [Rathayibacter rathayi]
MPDWSRFLPLGTGPSVDESGVSNDWRPLVAERLDCLAVLAASPSTAEGEAASPVSRDALLGDLVVRLSSSTGQRLATRMGAREASSPPPPAELASALAALATARRSGEGPRSVAELVEVVRVELALSLGPLALSSRISGGVALDRLQRAPLAIRAAVRGRTLAPTDAEWELGSGPALRAPVNAILRFLLGIGPFPADPETESREAQ